MVKKLQKDSKKKKIIEKEGKSKKEKELSNLHQIIKDKRMTIKNPSIEKQNIKSQKKINKIFSKNEKEKKIVKKEKEEESEDDNDDNKSDNIIEEEEDENKEIYEDNELEMEEDDDVDIDNQEEEEEEEEEEQEEEEKEEKGKTKDKGKKAKINAKDEEDEKEDKINEDSIEEDENEDNIEEDDENKNKKDKKEKKKKDKKDKDLEEKKKNLKLLSNPINNHYFTFQYSKDLFTLLYTSLIFKWIDTTKILILCETPKEGYKIDIFLREFHFNSIYLDREMPINTNIHFYNQYLKNNYQICVVNLEYSEKSQNFAKDILDNTKIPLTIIYFDCCSLELLEYHSFHPNARSIYHFMSNKDLFLDKYENLNENIKFNEFVFDREQMEHLRYRSENIYNGIRKSDIKKEKMRKINIDLLHSKNMEKFFKENPKEKEMVIKTIQENTITNFRPSVSFLPSYLIHSENNIIANAIKKEYKEKHKHNNNRRRNKKKKMEQYFEALDKGDGSQNLIKF